MPNYKAMYMKLLHASEQAVNLLIAAQLECEELGVSLLEPEPVAVLPPEPNKKAREE